MKYIKTFEARKTKFKKGDLVYCLNAKNMNLLNVGQVYKIDIVYIKNNNEEVVRLEELMVRYYNSDRFRLATPEEIEQYKLQKNANKYGL